MLKVSSTTLRGAAAIVATALLVTVLSVASARAAGPKPVISNVAVAPATVSSGHTTTITASVSGALTCTLSDKKLPGLPVTEPCEDGTFRYVLQMPTDTGKKELTYKLKLVATGPSGKATGKLTVVLSRYHYSPTPVDVQGLAGVTRLSVGSSTACALTSAPEVACWGDGLWGRLGDGGTEETDVPLEVQPLAEPTEIAMGGYLACALEGTGHAACWGEDGSKDGKGYDERPTEVDGLEEATQITAGSLHACALLASGHVDCWGSYHTGGNEVFDTPTPTEIAGLGEAVQVDAGGGHTCAVLAAGSVECWGSNDAGDLGDGSEEGSATGVTVAGIGDAVQVSAGGYDSCAVLAGGRVDCWGENSNGQLGDGSTASSKTPVEVSGITDAVEVSAGNQHTCALLTTGHVECWGYNARGQLGDDSTSSTDVPVEVPGISDATQIGASEAANTAQEEISCALLSGGQVQCWGSNEHGQLGDGSYD